MRLRHASFSLSAFAAVGLLGLGALSGCDDGSSNPSTPASTSTGSGDREGNGLSDALSNAQTQAEQAVDDAKARVEEGVEQAQDTVNEKKEEVEAAAADAKAELTNQAQRLIKEAESLLGAGDVSGAEGVLDKLQSMKDDLPENLQQQVEALASQINRFGDTVGDKLDGALPSLGD